MLRLYTFTLSHFSEKARWALDYNRVAYEERRLLPGAHVLVVRRRAPKSGVPLLDHDGTCVQGSGAILDYLEERLDATKLAVPEAARARAAEIEALADRAFGRGTQRIFYGPLLANREAVIDLWTQGGPRWGRAFYRVTYKLIARGVRRMYRIEPNAVAEAKDLFRRAFDETDRALEGTPFLLGAGPTRTDVSVAALLGPLCRPPEHVVRWPADVPEELASFVREFEGRPTWNFVLRMYRDHRGEYSRAR